MTAPTAPYTILRPRFAGTFTDGGQLYRLELEARVEPAQLAATGQTTTHEPIPAGALEFAISGTTWNANADGSSRDQRYRDISGGGQNVDDLRAVIEHGQPGPIGRQDLRLVLAHWDRWHLNGARPGCAHQPETWTCTNADAHGASVPNGWAIVRELFGEHPYPKRGDACHRCGRNRWDEPTDRCTESGYRFGTAWLYEPLPEPVIGDIRRIFGELRTYDTAGQPFPTP